MYARLVLEPARLCLMCHPTRLIARPPTLPSLHPAQVRVGVNIHHSVHSVALDTLVDHRLGGDMGAQVRRRRRMCVCRHSLPLLAIREQWVARLITAHWP